jgi:hypothetical protein
MNIEIKTVPLSELRFTTAGDWKQNSDGSITIWLVDTPDWRYWAIVLMHELTEILVCRLDDVTSASADAFDAIWENELKQGLHRPEEEAGCDRRCPYYHGHRAGIMMEKLFCFILRVPWKEYDDYWELFFRENYK